ncbi:MAG: GTPase ObgE [Verrucomicrobiales bacterium]
MFVDHLKIYARAGDGGNGVVHWIRKKFVPMGGPDGGDGGRGGHVIVEVDPHSDSLRQLFYHPRQIAQRGEDGSRQNMTGRNGHDLVVKVPAGTRIQRAEGDLVADLVHPRERIVLCHGGKGGFGNEHFKTSTNRAPQEATPGGPGEEGHFIFELRKIADAGMVGFPNAGKSSLVAALSAAKPKIAAYPFTTLKPMVGVVEYPGFLRATVADIPGLIEGAHENRGLGHEFLRHIMRCRLLLFVIDMAGSEAREPWDDLASLRTEVSLYSKELAERPWLIVANKMDLDGAKAKLKTFRQRFKRTEIVESSTVASPGVGALQERLRDLVAQRPE